MQRQIGKSRANVLENDIAGFQFHNKHVNKRVMMAQNLSSEKLLK